MEIALTLPCHDLKISADFYQRLITPLGRSIQPHPTESQFFVPFFYNIGLTAVERPGRPLALTFDDIDIEAITKILEQTLPYDHNSDLDLHPGHYHGYYESPGGYWLEFKDPDGNRFRAEERFISIHKSLP